MSNANDKRKIAIYSRKSKFTGKGDSVENQVEMCKKYLSNKYDNIDIINDLIIYEDEGYSGASTNRPKFQEMIKDIKEKKISSVICYRLDRISRNVSDFCSLKDELSKYDVSFISIKENFDTTTPMGNAMMMISSVFAQLERDTIAERIRDNMLELAKSGRWLGGITPTGFKSEAIEKINVDGKKKRLFKLAPIEDEIKLIKLIYDKFLELKSQTKLETYLIQNNIKSKNGVTYSRFAIKGILQNPVYAIADKDMLKYYQELDVEVFSNDSEFNGQHGVIAYNKTIQKARKSNKQRNVSEWIVAVGKHKGIIEGSKWVQIQDIVNNNINKRYRRPTINNSLLSGLIRCSKCGSYMRPKLKKLYDSEGRQRFDYMCELKEKSRKHNCDCKNINGIETDKLVLETIKGIVAPNAELYKALKDIINSEYSTEDKNKDELKILKTSYDKNQKDIENLINNIVVASIEAMPELNNKLIDLKQKAIQLEKQIKDLTDKNPTQINDKETAKLVLDILDNYFSAFDTLDLMQKRNLLRLLISSIETDGETLVINLVGARNLKNNSSIPLGEYSK